MFGPLFPCRSFATKVCSSLTLTLEKSDNLRTLYWTAKYAPTIDLIQGIDIIITTHLPSHSSQVKQFLLITKAKETLLIIDQQ